MTLTERDLRRMHLLHERELRARLHRVHRTEVLAAREVFLRGGRAGRVPNGQAGRTTR